MSSMHNRRQLGRYALVIVIGSALLLTGCHKKDQQKKPPKISLLTPAVPPPPPPPKVEKKPEPPKEQKEMKVDQPVAKKVEPQVAQELKMDGPAGNGPSGFAQGAITSEDLSKIGTGKTGGGEQSGMFNPFNNYARGLKGDLQRYLNKNNALRQRRYSIDVHVWVDPAGQVKRFELIGSSNDSDTDDAVRTAMTGFAGFSQGPPPGMPQPVRMRIVAGA